MSFRFMFPESWLVPVVVVRGGGGSDRWGDPLPVERITVARCLIGPRFAGQDEALGAWTDTDAALYHESFRFEQSDLVEVEAGTNRGVWEVQAPSGGWPFGTETRLRRVNQA